MNEAVEPSNYQTIKLFLEQIDRAESAKKIIAQAQQALKNKDDVALSKIGFTNQHIAELKNRSTAGKTPPYFASTTTLDNVISRLRHELRKAVKNSNQPIDMTKSAYPFTQTSAFMSTTHRIDYLCLPG